MPAPVRLADLTTLRVGGPAGRFVDATTDEQIVAEVRAADRDGVPLLVIGSGSNLLVADAGFDGTVLRVSTAGIETDGAIVRAAAGEDWDAFVAGIVSGGRVGVETLAGIPGRVGAAPVQNVGAYGAEVAATIVRVQAFDRSADRLVSLGNDDCGFGYRSSVFKETAVAGTGRFVILAVHFRLPPAGVSAPLRYAELARQLGVPLESRAPLADVRSAVLGLRRAKGMVLDPADHDTWSAGSFFTNPILSPEQAAALPADAPRFAAATGVKTSAAWLIERAGFARGHGDGPARVSTKHTLAVTNRGAAGAADVLALAREIRDGVEAAFGIRLVPEPVVVGAEL